jgi:dTMP kinase
MIVNLMRKHVAFQVKESITDELILKGRFIVFEGLDGSGTTTQTAFLANWLDSKGLEVVATKEPTDGLWGGIIRGVLKGELDSHPLSLCHAFMADRIDHIQKLQNQTNRYKRPIILSDRYQLSYLAYQQKDTHKSIEWLHRTQQGLPVPDITIFLDVPPTTCFERMKKSRITQERYENINILERISEGYYNAIDFLHIHGQNIKILDGTLPILKLHEKIVSIVQDFL